MTSWKRDFASGLVVIVPVLVTAYVVAWLYAVLSNVTPRSLISVETLVAVGVSERAAAALVQPLRVSLVLLVFLLLVLSVGYLMRTAVGGAFEGIIDDLANRLPGLRVVYNASKMAAETALGGAESLQEPVKLEPWDGMRMTAFKTGKRAEDGREVIFLPTAPNITTGYVIEVEEAELTESDESVEDALTRILSAGFGENSDVAAPVDVDAIVGDGDEAE
jgi:uncharacterized membrane protein